MRAPTVVPGAPGSGALCDLREPDPRDGRVLVATRSIGICGTDRELLAGEHGAAPPGDPSLGEAGGLREPTSVVAKAWEHIERIGRRATWRPRTVLVTGAGPTGLLAALLGVQHGFDVHVLDLVNDGLKPHYELGAAALVAADPLWLSALLTRPVPLDDYAQALVPQEDGVKTRVVF